MTIVDLGSRSKNREKAGQSKHLPKVQISLCSQSGQPVEWQGAQICHYTRL